MRLLPVEGFFDEDKLKLKIKIMKANQQLLHDSARAIATLAHVTEFQEFMNSYKMPNETIKMADGVQDIRQTQ